MKIIKRLWNIIVNDLDILSDLFFGAVSVVIILSLGERILFQTEYVISTLMLIGLAGVLVGGVYFLILGVRKVKTEYKKRFGL